MNLIILKQLILRHFTSEGFKDRLSHIYLPMLKKGGAYLWNKYADRKELKLFSKAYSLYETVEAPEVTDVAGAGATGVAIPPYEKIASHLKVWFTESTSQGDTAQCVAFTLDNIIRAITKLIGLGNIAVSPLDAYIDRVKQRRGDFTGMSVSGMFADVAKKGVAVGELLPRMTEQANMFTVDDRAMYPDNLIDLYRVKILKGATPIGKDWRTIMNTINSLPMGFPVQITMNVTDGYFGYDIPTTDQTTLYGGHSVCAIGGSGCIVDGKEGFFITDSAFYKNRVTRFGTTIRFITKDYWVKNGLWVMLPTFVEPVQSKAMAVPLVKIETSYSLRACKKGEQGEHVRALQNALIFLGETLPSGATGFYGKETASALLSFQLKNVTKFTVSKDLLRTLAGESFGEQTLKVINTLLADK